MWTVAYYMDYMNKGKKKNGTVYNEYKYGKLINWYWRQVGNALKRTCEELPTEIAWTKYHLFKTHGKHIH